MRWGAEPTPGSPSVYLLRFSRRKWIDRVTATRQILTVISMVSSFHFSVPDIYYYRGTTIQ